MDGIEVSCWEEFEQKLPELKPSGSSRNSPLLFRGQSDSSWPLNTSLERYGVQDYSFMKYFTVMHRVRPQIETFTSYKWDMPTSEDLQKWTTTFGSPRDGFLAADYMMYLRHYGFPSPLLDWTESSKIAGYFAFRQPNEPASTKVSIYVFLERPKGMKTTSSDRADIFNVGRLAARHHRHFLQQSSYTVCMNFSTDESEAKREWRFAKHENVVNRERVRPHSPLITEFTKHENMVNRKPEPEFRQDVLWKFNIPWSERRKVLKLLDEYNLNAHSLFGSEESLMETLAFREIDLP